MVKLVDPAGSRFCQELFSRFEREELTPQTNDRLLNLARDGEQPFYGRLLAAAFLGRRLRHLLDASGDDPEALRLCRELGLVETGGRGARLTSAVADSGYAARTFKELRAELSSRLAAWPSLHQARSWQDLVRHPFRLTLARHLVTPAEVIAELTTRVAVSRGTGRRVDDAWGVADDEARRELANLPEYEREIVLRLLRGHAVYWALPADGDRFDDLILQPPGTVVLVVRPPGSDWELEIKRAGMARSVRGGLQPLSIAASRVYSHRLVGGSGIAALVWEASAAACFAKAYRQIHHQDPALSRTLALRTVLTVPSRRGQAFLIDYFTDADIFGDGYGEMRRAIRATFDLFAKEEGNQPIERLPGDVGAATAFMQRLVPAQSLLSGTSVYRLDRVAESLSAGSAGNTDDPAARAEMLDLLALVLDGFTPPQNPVDPDLPAAAMAEHRASADAIYRRLLEQIGQVWGTLLGLGGFSYGESFVGRNVGLRRRWHQGQPRVELVFMDHDNLVLPPKNQPVPLSPAFFEGMLKDDLAIFGGALRGSHLQGIADLLERIYRCDLLHRERCRASFREILASSYRHARQALRSDAALRELFHPELSVLLDERDAGVKTCLAGGNWHQEVRQKLEKRGHASELADAYLKAVEKYAPFLRRYQDLLG